jgi:hypothetical protein
MPSLIVVAVLCAWLAYFMLLRMEPGVDFLTSLRGKVSSRAKPVFTMHRKAVSSVSKPAIIPVLSRPATSRHVQPITWLGSTPAIIPMSSRPDTVRYVQPIVWLESMGFTRHVSCVLGLPFYLLFVALATVDPYFMGQGITLSLCWLTMVVGIEANPSAFALRGTPAFLQQFPLSLAVPRRLYFRIKIAFWTAVTFGLTVPIGLLCALGVQEETTLPLSHGVADMLNAQISAESLSALGAGTRLVPSELYASYTVPSGKTAYLLAAACLLSIAYFFFWWPVAKSYMETPARLRRIQTGSTYVQLTTRLSGLPLLLLLFGVAFGFSGIVLSWTFALAYTHPFYLIIATIAVCLVLEQIAERQFLNIEIVE